VFGAAVLIAEAIARGLDIFEQRSTLAFHAKRKRQRAPTGEALPHFRFSSEAV